MKHIVVMACLLLACRQAGADGGRPADRAEDNGTANCVSTQRLLRDSEWETTVYTVTAKRPGPTLLVVGGMHGNEPAGYRAAEQVRQWPLARGKLVVIARANVPAIEKHSRTMPGVPAAERDLNRNFPRDSSSDGPQGHVAAAIWKFAKALKPDWVIDLHEGYEFNTSHHPPPGKKKSVGSSIIYFHDDSLDVVVARMLQQVNATVKDEDRKLVRLSRGPVDGSLVRASVRKLGARGMILETTFKDQPISLRTRQQRMMVSVLLQHLQMIDHDCTDTLATKVTGHDPVTARPLTVGLFDGSGTTSQGRRNVIRTLESAGDIGVHFLGPADLEPEVLNQFDVLVFPGGSGSRQAAAIGKSRRDHIRTFVKGGGGYVGICAGAYLCSAHYPWSLKLIDTHVFTGAREIEGVGKKQMWYRGGPATVKMQFTAEGKKVFGQNRTTSSDAVDVRYQNGPIVSRQHAPDLAPFTTLAFFRSENAAYPPQRGTMIDTPAIVVAPHGAGRVVSIGPHPEATQGLEHVVTALVRWSVSRPAPPDQEPIEGAAAGDHGPSQSPAPVVPQGASGH